MAIVLSQAEYWALFSETTTTELEHVPIEIVQSYPQALGCGSVHQIHLREGLELAIVDYHPQDQIVLHSPEREHPLEYSFFLSGQLKDKSCVVGAGQYALYGSGIAPVDKTEWLASERILEVNVHIDPDLFVAFWNLSSTVLQPELQQLLSPDLRPYYWRSGTTTSTMQTALQQIIHCPFHGITKRIYLESKVWELLALLLEQELERRQKVPVESVLKQEDIDRIHHARDILFQRFDDPPSLLELAHQVGLNDCTLKRGFRQVFGKTAFGYLHEYRLERARQLLAERRLNVSEVARAIGFTNRSYFAAAFKKKFGITPKIYQGRYRNSA